MEYTVGTGRRMEYAMHFQVEFLYGRQSIRPLRTFTAGEPNAALLWLAFHPAVWVAT